MEIQENAELRLERIYAMQRGEWPVATDLELVPSPNLPKNEDSRQPQCPEDKERAIVEALQHFKMIQQKLKEADKSKLVEEKDEIRLRI